MYNLQFFNFKRDKYIVFRTKTQTIKKIQKKYYRLKFNKTRSTVKFNLLDFYKNIRV